jgi:hypothetical protein
MRQDWRYVDNREQRAYPPEGEMLSSAEQRIKDMGLSLPSGSAPAAVDLIAVTRTEIGSLDKVARVVEVQGFSECGAGI